MFKFISIFCLTFISTSCLAQKALTPGVNSFEKKWLNNGSNEMIWYLLKDSTKIEIGKVTTQFSLDEKVLTVITQVIMKNMTSSWIDSTVADIQTLKPIRHSSSNQQREMALNFNSIITGFYWDKAKNKITEIQETVNGDYFDSNLYPILISWLPLHEGYQRDISIYDYNPSSKIGIMNAKVIGVQSGNYSTKSGIIEVWIVTVTDEISHSTSKYYIDKLTRTAWMQEMNTGSRNMVFERIE
jgi:hypothetical protein